MNRKLGIGLVAVAAGWNLLFGGWAGAQAQLSDEERAALSPNIAERAAAIEDKASDFIDNLAAGEYELAQQMLAEALQPSFPPDAIARIWEEAVEKVGGFVDRGVARYEWGVDSDFVALPIAFENAEGDLLLIFDAEQRIVGLDFPPLNTQSPEEVASRFVDSLAAGEYAEARRDLHPVLKGEFLPEDLEERWLGLQAVAGEFRERLSSDIRVLGDRSVVLVSLEFANLTDNLFVVLNDSGQIVSVDFPQEH